MSAALAQERFTHQSIALSRPGRRLPGRLSPQRYVPPITLEQNTEILSSRNPTYLGREVYRVKREEKPSGETPWYFLAGTGFFVKEQIAQMQKSIEEAVQTGNSHSHAIEGEMLKVGQDVVAFEQEYLRQLLLLPIVLQKNNINGTERIIAPNYNGKLWEATVNTRERGGSINHVLFKGDPSGYPPSIENWLLYAKPGSMAIMVSPNGWSGLYDANGHPIVYPETQIYAWQVQPNGQPKGFSFRYDGTFEQNAHLQRLLGLHTNYQEDHDGIEQMIKNVAFIDAGGSFGFEQLVDLMQQVKGGSTVAYQGKTFAEIKQLLREPQHLWDLDKKTPLLIEAFRDFARWELANMSAETTKNLQMGMAITILQLTNEYQTQGKITTQIRRCVPSAKTTYINRAPDSKQMPMYQQFNYSYAAQALRTLPGCGGGGIKLEADGGITFINSVTARAARVAGTLSQKQQTDASESYSLDEKYGVCLGCQRGPQYLGPCSLCASCDASEKSKALLGNLN